MIPWDWVPRCITLVSLEPGRCVQQVLNTDLLDETCLIGEWTIQRPWCPFLRAPAHTQGSVTGQRQTMTAL